MAVNVPGGEFDEIQQIVGAAAQPLKETYLKQDAITKNMTEGVKALAVSVADTSKGAELLSGILGRIGDASEKNTKLVVKPFEAMHKASKTATENVTKDMDAVGKKAEDAAKKAAQAATDAWDAHIAAVKAGKEALAKQDIADAKRQAAHNYNQVQTHDKFINSLKEPSLWEKLGEINHKKPSEIIGDKPVQILAEINQGLMGLVPGIAAVASISGLIMGVVNAFIHLSDEEAKFGKLNSGDAGPFKQFLDSVDAVSAQTHMTEDKIREFGLAFYGLGGDISTAGAALDGVEISSGKAMKFFDIAPKEMAKYDRAWIASGKTVGDVTSSLYGKMTSLHLGTDDYVSSLASGYTAWQDLGAISGRTAGQMQGDMLGVTALFHSFNMDVGLAADSMARLFGSTQSQYRQAALVANTFGMSQEDALLEKYSDPEAAMRHGMLGALMSIQSRSGVGSDVFKSVPELLKGGYSKYQTSMIQMGKQVNTEQMSALWNQNPAVVKQLMNAFHDAQSASSGGKLSLQDWMNSASQPGAPGDFQTAFAKAMAAGTETLFSIEQKAGSFFNVFAETFMPQFLNFCAWIENALSYLPNSKTLDQQARELEADNLAKAYEKYIKNPDDAEAYQAYKNARFSGQQLDVASALAGAAGAPAPISGLTGKMPNKERAAQMMQFLINKGLSPAQAAGIAGSIQQESGFKTNNVNPDTGAVGIMQWLGGRKERLYKYAASVGASPMDYGTQLGFMWQESLAGPEKRNWDTVKSTHTIDQAALAFTKNVERPDMDENSKWPARMAKRIDNGNQYYELTLQMEKIVAKLGQIQAAADTHLKVAQAGQKTNEGALALKKQQALTGSPEVMNAGYVLAALNRGAHP